MEREALAALEKRIEALRLLAAEKSVYARALTTEPYRHTAEISTALLALVVLTVFLVGREVGIVTSNEACDSIGASEFARLTVATDTWSVTLDTNGNMERTGSEALNHPETVKRHVSPDEVRTLANRLARGCFFEHWPPTSAIADGVPLTVRLRAGGRVATYDDKWSAVPLCNGTDTIGGVAEGVMKLARVREELFVPP